MKKSLECVGGGERLNVGWVLLFCFFVLNKWWGWWRMGFFVN